MNYNKTYALVVKSICFKMIFGKVAKEDLKIEKLDMITVFLNSFNADGLLIYIEKLIGYETLEDLVCFLFQTLHGLKKSTCLWYLTLYNFLISMRFCQRKANHSVFIQGKIIIIVYVNELLLRESMDEINSIK